jgi:hypothetical protein
MNFKRKIPSFVFGLSIGLLIGVAYFVFEFNSIFASIKSSIKEQAIVTEKKVEDKSYENYTSKDNRFKINLGKTNKVNYKEVDSLIKTTDDIKVASEEFISVKNIKLISFSQNNHKDSTITKLADVKPDDNNNLYFVEFWKTPLNSKGYRFTKNKVMLYGFVDHINVELYELENNYYIKCSDQVFKLFYSSDFKPLEKVVDVELLAKIN